LGNGVDTDDRGVKRVRRSVNADKPLRAVGRESGLGLFEPDGRAAH